MIGRIRRHINGQHYECAKAPRSVYFREVTIRKKNIEVNNEIIYPREYERQPDWCELDLLYVIAGIDILFDCMIVSLDLYT